MYYSRTLGEYDESFDGTPEEISKLVRELESIAYEKSHQEEFAIAKMKERMQNRTPLVKGGEQNAKRAEECSDYTCELRR